MLYCNLTQQYLEDRSKRLQLTWSVAFIRSRLVEGDLCRRDLQKQLAHFKLSQTLAHTHEKQVALEDTHQDVRGEALDSECA